MQGQIEQFLELLQQGLQNNSFVKLNLGDYKGAEPGLKNVYIKLLFIKQLPKLSFVYRYQTRDITKNYSIEEAIELLNQLIGNQGFKLAQLFTLQADYKLQASKQGQFSLRQEKASQQALPSTEHDRAKKRKLPSAGKAYLHALGLSDEEGIIYNRAQDKFKQINHYIELLSNLLKDLPERPLTHIVDMGSGKGYLTFALYDYLNEVLHKQTQVTGVEFRKDMVELCNNIAEALDYKHLNFVEGTIEQYVPPTEIHVLVALHACDTATDEAIYKGITAGADLIVVAPCCHKQIRREMEQHKANNALDFVVKHGIFMERQAEMLTDALRALILEYHGYSTKVFEFISDAHTPKNVLIVGQRKTTNPAKQQAILDKIQSSKAYFGIARHHLETLMQM